jgi:UDP-N-acetylglucosamine 2-epimerase (non-hydrolysing)
LSDKSMLKVLSIFGTRPEAIKMAPVIKALEKNEKEFRSLVCITAQHRHMLDQVLSVFNIIPDYDLNIMKESQDLFDITCNVMAGLKLIIGDVKPDIVLVHGDTTTTMAAAISSYYLKTRIGHVEAGLRTRNKYAPFPEEINRKITDDLADIHFAPTDEAKQNLIFEGIDSKTIVVTGNTVIDALISVSNLINQNRELKQKAAELFPFLDPNKKLILVTGHRRENFGKGFENICAALYNIATRFSDKVEIIYPVHLNPNVQEPVKRILGDTNLRNVFLIEPVDYLPFVYLMKRAYLIISDSGGVQEEAPSLGKPVLVMREATERPEAVRAGTVKLVGTDRDEIVNETTNLLENADDYSKMAQARNPYGDGKASERIVDTLRKLKK